MIERYLDKDYYTAQMIGKNITFQRILLVKNEPHWEWRGVLHEIISSSKPVSGELLEGVINEYNHVQGFRSLQKDKWLQDQSVLEKALSSEPDNTRYVFYLAQIYGASGEWEKALQMHEKRVCMDPKTQGKDAEVFWSLYMIGCLQSDLKKPHDRVIDSFLKAFQYDETRAEPLYRLALQFQEMQSYILGYLLMKRAIEMPRPKLAMQVEHAVYDYLIELKLAEFTYLIGKTDEALKSYRKLIENVKVPPETKEMIEKNIEILSR